MSVRCSDDNETKIANEIRANFKLIEFDFYIRSYLSGCSSVGRVRVWGA